MLEELKCEKCQNDTFRVGILTGSGGYTFTCTKCGAVETRDHDDPEYDG